MVSTLVLIPSDAAAVGRVERLDAQNDFLVFDGTSIDAVGSQHIRVTSPHGNTVRSLAIYQAIGSQLARGERP